MAVRAALFFFMVILNVATPVVWGQAGTDTRNTGAGSSGETPPFPDCPCLSSEQVASGLAPARDGDCIRSAALPGVCLPLDYGQGGCQAWDSSMYQGCAGTQAPRWCALKWCFVDPANCTRPNEPSVFLPLSSLHYSYATCGYVDTFQQRVVSDDLANRTLRVSYPPDGTWELTTLPDGSKAGAYNDLFFDIAAEWNITVVEVPIPEVSISQFDSVFTACIHAIAINSTDVCIASFWVTVERTTMVEFPHGIHHDKFYLVTRMYSSQITFAEMISRPFLPFHWQLWLVILGTLIVVAVLYAWVEGQHTKGSLPSPDGSSSSGDSSAHPHWISDAPDAVNESFMGFFTGAPLYAPTTAPGKIIVTGFAFLILVLITSYTASLTAFFTKTDISVQFLDLDDAIQKRAKICVYESVRRSLVSTYPNLDGLYVIAEQYVEEGDDMMDLIDRGVCDTAIMTENDFLFLQNQHCDKVLVGQPVFLLVCALSVTQDISQAISSEMVEREMLGTWAEMVQANKDMFMPEPNCPALSDAGDSPALGVREMAGVLIIFALMLLGAIVVQIVLMSMKTKHAHAVFSKASTLMRTASASMPSPIGKYASNSGVKASNGFPPSPCGRGEIESTGVL
mmetsp:Transcript_10600/g.30180  ORF Transcript_10600/g.30180 Transcript_10600/m.30180 type:complete len:623 (-) Transcript_10600:101-1969(-)|eukprot:CAMPEP_0117672882 /NCGR_PEP_ID=MMETSP0804-20121206/14161_1 /TAXON_ID=1074897 /ORGANISM="Tetraselmis astigmatica, Strain CCMP880" /LENGTH=622 /DNA_ID=CAMNT_0005481553 /DNA_START=114 /DNA_END=1982 /DNA_ORIENTATION=+